MAEYLSPGVYVEEFDSGSKSMEGVGTSTAGFVGAAERGPVGGEPQLVTNFADFRRKYGGYLSEEVFGENRYLAYAVEHFFMNGGSRCFISRVCPSDAKNANGVLPAESPVIRISAKNPGFWGNDLKIRVTPASKAKTQILAMNDTPHGTNYQVKKAAGFNVGDVVALTEGTTVKYNRITK
ncbi:MAG: phage tail sheath family protein, partial [Oscillospiraceae bacterium]|nr:phage tail sheath family protein [Oscillospiraceae bacterium]